LGLLVMVRRGVSVRVPRTVLPWVVAAGAGDIAANALYLVAVQDGLMSVIAPIAALYPVSTVLLALAGGQGAGTPGAVGRPCLRRRCARLDRGVTGRRLRT
jgi:hypothetical protein